MIERIEVLEAMLEAALVLFFGYILKGNRK